MERWPRRVDLRAVQRAALAFSPHGAVRRVPAHPISRGSPALAPPSRTRRRVRARALGGRTVFPSWAASGSRRRQPTCDLHAFGQSQRQCPGCNPRASAPGGSSRRRCRRLPATPLAPIRLSSTVPSVVWKVRITQPFHQYTKLTTRSRRGAGARLTTRREPDVCAGCRDERRWWSQRVRVRPERHDGRGRPGRVPPPGPVPERRHRPGCRASGRRPSAAAQGAVPPRGRARGLPPATRRSAAGKECGVEMVIFGKTAGTRVSSRNKPR